MVKWRAKSIMKRTKKEKIEKMNLKINNDNRDDSINSLTDKTKDNVINELELANKKR